MSMTKAYNILSGENRLWAILNHFPIAEYATKIKGVRKRPVDTVSKVAGNREFGFIDRRKSKDEVPFAPTVDGTGLKKAKRTACRPRKMPSRLATTFEVYMGSMDPVVKQEREDSFNKAKRARNRNRRALYGRK